MLNTKEILETSLSFIENNIYSKFSLDDIAKYSGVSKYHLHRIFKSLTGEALMDYVQARKLTSSIDKLVSTNMRIIDT